MTGLIIPKVFKVWPDEGFELLLPVEKDDHERSTFNGQPLTGAWTPMRVKRVREGKSGSIRKIGDFSKGSIGDLVLTGHAKMKVGTIFEQYGELLPLACDEGEYWTLNVTYFIDALDEERSVVLRAPDENRILLVDKYVFDGRTLENAMLFKIPQLRRGAFFVTDPFVKMIRSTGLVGLTFEQIWAPN